MKKTESILKMNLTTRVNQKFHKLMAKMIGLDEKTPLGGHPADIEHLKSAFRLIIAIVGIDGVSPPEIIQIKKRLQLICKVRSLESKNFIKELNQFCDSFIEQINGNQMTRENIINNLTIYAKDFLFHLHRLNIPGNRIYIIMYAAIMIAYGDNVFSADEQFAVYEVAKALNIKNDEIECIVKLAKINWEMKYNAKQYDAVEQDIDELFKIYKTTFKDALSPL